MAEKRIVVPDGMLKAAITGLEKEFGIGTNVGVYDSFAPAVIIEAAMLWMSENPIVPTAEQLYSTIGKLPVSMCDIVWPERDRAMIAEWQRTMFLAPVPAEIKDLLGTPEKFDRYKFNGGKVVLRVERW